VARDLSVYVHLPFCLRKCHYCDFNSRPAAESERARYLAALKLEIQRRAELLGASHIRTIFLGGGTPTIYHGEELAGLLEMLKDTAASPPPAPRMPETGGSAGVRTTNGMGRGGTSRFAGPSPVPPSGRELDRAAPPTAAPRTEVTCEANPETVDVAKLRVLREAGFNRLSVGAQSFDDDELRMLGRGHSAEQTALAVAAAREAGFTNLSLDLIYALPGQTLNSWRQTLLRALELQPDHLSAYGLEICEGTPFHARLQAGEIAPVEEAEHLAMRQVTRELCEAAGLDRYEISNYARPGFECAHNITYWRNEEYLGLGAGAWSYLDGVRSGNMREPREYRAAIEAGESPEEYAEELAPEDALAEALMMGLRMTEGLLLHDLAQAYGAESIEALLQRARPLVEMALVEVGAGRIRLTEAGEELHSEVVMRLT
jgi:oxygen-independent coproporphyrinogen-3 oxidase